MFRDVVYMTHDYTIRVQDGWVIFRWWRAYVPKNASDDLSHSDTRLSVMLNGFELHMYNRTSLYANLEKLFGIEPQAFPKDESDSKEGKAQGSLVRRQLGTALTGQHRLVDLRLLLLISTLSQLLFDRWRQRSANEYQERTHSQHSQ